MKQDALLPLSLFKSSTFSMSTILGVIVGVGMFGGMMTLPLILQIVYGATPTEAGFLMLPMVAGLMVASIVSGQITSRTGKYKIFMLSGTAMMTLAYLYMAQMRFDWQIWQVSFGMVFMGLGLGQLMQTLTIASQNAVASKDIGVATSSATFFRQMGGTLGVAVFLSILFTDLGNRGSQIGEGIKAAIANNPALLSDPRNAVFKQAGTKLGDLITSDSSFLNKISPELAAPIKQAFAESANTVFFVAFAVIAVSFFLSWFLKEVALRTKSAVQEKAEEVAAAAMH
jgi:MFS family permease